jgi:flagellar biosynthesis GTPase FlhF
MKKWLLSTLAVAMVATAAQASELQQPYNKLKKQIDIMSNIISSSLSEGNRRNRNNLQVEGVYLKSQGIVFEINSGRGLSHIFRQFGRDIEFDVFTGSGNSRVSIPSVPSISPVIIADGEYGEAIAAEVGRSMDVYEDAMEAFEERSEYARELREEQRELAYEMRNIARRKRDLEFEARHAEDDRTKELKDDLAELAQEAAKLGKKENELSVRAEKEEKSLKSKKIKRNEKVKKAKQAYFSKLDNAIAETLCDYGAGLRQLAKTEHVTFIIDMGHDAKSGNTKKIHAFSKKDIVSCVMEGKTPAQLLNAAQSYYF